jgi:hypothetical protein
MQAMLVTGVTGAHGGDLFEKVTGAKPLSLGEALATGRVKL